MGPAVDTLQALLDEGKADSFDFAFIGMGLLCSLSVSYTGRVSGSISCTACMGRSQRQLP